MEVRPDRWNKMQFFQVAVVFTLLYGCTTWTLTKRIEKKLDRNCRRMLRTVLNKSLKQHATKQLLHGHLPPISKTIQIRRRRHAVHCWRRGNEFICDILLWTPSHGRASVGRPTRTYPQQLGTNTGCILEDLPKAMDDRDEGLERLR